jgi:hypothetical protein
MKNTIALQLVIELAENYNVTYGANMVDAPRNQRAIAQTKKLLKSLGIFQRTKKGKSK